MTEHLPPPVWIDQPDALTHLAHALTSHPKLALDTESNSLYAYREQVCLIQFSTHSTDFLIDPLALSDLSSIAPVFSNPSIEKVIHAAEYDQICLKRDFDIALVHIFDTMQAARILGYKRVGLDSILADKLGITLSKRYQKADWGKRPLTPEMLSYARLDTHHLLELRDVLESELRQRSRWELAQEEFARLAAGNGSTRADLPSWQRVKGTKDLNSRQFAILNELCHWRNQQAEHMHRPVFKVIDDRRLVAIVQAVPRTESDLESIPLSSRQIHSYGDEILASVRRGWKAPPLERPNPAHPGQAALARLKWLSDWRKEVARKMHVESDIILPKSWMHAIAEKNPASINQLAKFMPNSPWRLSNFGKEILLILQGKRLQ